MWRNIALAKAGQCAADKALDRNGKPLLMKLNGKAEAYFW